MSLTLKEKTSIDVMLDEKVTRSANREHNKKEIAKLRAQRLQEDDWIIRHQLLRSIGDGQEMITKQTKRISELSITKIAEKLGLSFGAVTYYQNSSYVRMKRQYGSAL